MGNTRLIFKVPLSLARAQGQLELKLHYLELSSRVLTLYQVKLANLDLCDHWWSISQAQSYSQKLHLSLNQAWAIFKQNEQSFSSHKSSIIPSQRPNLEQPATCLDSFRLIPHIHWETTMLCNSVSSVLVCRGPWPCFFVVIRIMSFKILLAAVAQVFWPNLILTLFSLCLLLVKLGNLAFALDKFAFLNMVFLDLE